MTPPAPGRGSVLVSWLLTEQVEARQWPLLLSLLDEQERQRAGRFHFERDRHSYVAAHALLRGTLSRLLSGPPDAWQFEIDGYGKPELVASPGEPRLRVNISHTRGLAAVALALEQDVGVDVEWVEPRRLTLDLADRFFAPAECASLTAIPPGEVTEALFAFWTLKEAYIKAVGLGLSLPLDAFAFTLEPLSISFASSIADHPDDWHFQRFRPSPSHVMALAVRHGAAEPPKVTAEPASLGDLLRLAEAEDPYRADDQGRIWRR